MRQQHSTMRAASVIPAGRPITSPHIIQIIGSHGSSKSNRSGFFSSTRATINRRFMPAENVVVLIGIRTRVPHIVVLRIVEQVVDQRVAGVGAYGPVGEHVAFEAGQHRIALAESMPSRADTLRRRIAGILASRAEAPTAVGSLSTDCCPA